MLRVAPYERLWLVCSILSCSATYKIEPGLINWPVSLSVAVSYILVRLVVILGVLKPSFLVMKGLKDSVGNWHCIPFENL